MHVSVRTKNRSRSPRLRALSHWVYVVEGSRQIRFVTSEKELALRVGLERELVRLVASHSLWKGLLTLSGHCESLPSGLLGFHVEQLP